MKPQIITKLNSRKVSFFLNLIKRNIPYIIMDIENIYI